MKARCVINSTTTSNEATLISKVNKTITFISGGTTLGTQIVYKDTPLTTFKLLGGTAPSGTKFYGWATANNSYTRSYTDGGEINPTANITLYAIYSQEVDLVSGLSQAQTITTYRLFYYSGSTAKYRLDFIAPQAISGYTAMSWATVNTQAPTQDATSITPSGYTAQNPDVTTYYATYKRNTQIPAYSGPATADRTTTNIDEYYNTGGYWGFKTPTDIATITN